MSASDFIVDMFKSNKYIKVSFLFNFFYRKCKTKQLALKLGDPKFALH